MIADSSLQVQYAISGRVTDASRLILWQRELLTVTVSIRTKEEFSYIKPINYDNKNYKIETHVSTKTIRGNNDFIKTMHIFIWPHEPGQQSLILKDIELVLSGRVINKYSLPSLSMDIKPLPEYLPPNLPVGQIDLNVALNNQSLIPFIFLKDNISFATIQVNSRGIHPDLIPLYSNLELSDNITLLDSKIIENRQLDNSFQVEQMFEIPFVTTSTGLIPVSDIKLIYFDPVKSKITTRTIESARLISLNAYTRLVILSVLLYIAFSLVTKLKHWLLMIRQRRNIWREILHCTTPGSFSKSIIKLLPHHTFAREHKYKGYAVDLSDWSQKWGSERLLKTTSYLNQINYAADNTRQFEDVKIELINHLKQLEWFIYYAYLQIGRAHV